MLVTMTRLFTTFSRVTCAAWPKAPSVLALSPVSQSKTMLSAMLSQTCGAPGSRAVARSVTAGSTS